MKDDKVLDITDYSGRQVLLRKETWTHHIQAKHPEMLGCLRRVENTLRSPSFVYEDREFEATRLYYRLGAIDRFRHLYLVVVLGLDRRPAQVTTAYVARSPSESAGRLAYVKARH
jgi:hypothetical protein